MATSIDPREIRNFSRDSARWWDETGPFAPLHRINPVRLSCIRTEIGRHYGCPPDSLTPFKGLNILDIGCGGGLTCEPLSRLGAAVTGIDADENAIRTARDHAESAGLPVTYKAAAAEDLLKASARYDAVLALEIAEHVTDPEEFVRTCIALCRPGGIVIFSTLNRTAQSFALGIVAAEYLLRWVPRGTHDWRKFIRPSELARMVRRAGARPAGITGLRYNPFKTAFELSDKDVGTNYILAAVKP